MKIKLDAKHVLSVVAVLALIGGGAGALIGTVNYFTSPVISENDDKKENEAYYKCFPDAASFSDETEVSSGTYIETYKSALDASGNEIGKVYHAVGATGFGANVDLLIGVDADGLAHIEIVAYGPDNTGGNNATVEAWIESINDGSATIDGGITTGATNTASVVRAMVAEALDLYENGDVTPPPVTGGEKYYNLFEGGASAGDKVSVASGSLDHYREVKDASGNILGRAYYGGGLNVFGVSINVIVGVTPEGEVTKLYLDAYSGGEQMGTDTTIKNWIDEVNSGDREWTAGPSAGASYEVIKGVIDEAIAHYTSAAPAPTYEESVYLGLFEGASSIGAFRELGGNYLTGRVDVLDADGEVLGYAYEGEGKNSYNVHIALVVGVKTDGTVTKLYLGDYSGGNPAGTETSVNEWIDKVNDGTGSIEAGPSATYSYQVIKGIIDEAVGYATGAIVDPSENYLELFEGASSLGEEVELTGDYGYIASYREVKGSSGAVLGRGYITNTTNVGDRWGNLQLLIGVYLDGTISKVIALTDEQSRPDGTNEYIESVNGGGDYEDIFGYESSSGTVGIEITHDAIAEAIGDYTGVANLPAEITKAMASILPDAAGWGQPTVVNEGYIIGRMPVLDEDGVESGASYYLSGVASDGEYDLVILVKEDGSFTLSLVSGDWDSAYLAGVEAWIAKINDGSAHYRDDIKDSGVNQAAYAIAANIEAVLAYETETTESPYLALWDGSYSVSSSQAVEGGTYLHSYREVRDGAGKVLGRGYLTKVTSVPSSRGSYGDIQALIAVNKDGTIKEVTLLQNTQSIPGSTDEYAGFVNGGGNYEEVPEYSGGTIGVDILKDMIGEALAHYEQNPDQVVDPSEPVVPTNIPESVKALIPEAHSWNAFAELSAVWQATGYWSALDESEAEIGRVYEFKAGSTGDDNLYYVALDEDAEIIKLEVVNTTLEGENLTALTTWVEQLNTGKAIPEIPSDSPIASELGWIESGIEDAQADYLGDVPAAVEEKVASFVTESFGENAKFDMPSSVSNEDIPEVTNRYNVYVPSDDPMGGTPTYPGDVWLAHVKTDSYDAYVLIAVGDLITDEVDTDAARYLVCSEEGTRDTEAIDAVVEALLAL